MQRVVELVLEHATNRPRESLMVISGSAKHAVRVQQAVMKALVRRGDLTDFVLGDQAEPFMVVTLAEAVGAEPRPRHLLHRLRPHAARARPLDFGPLAKPGGDRLLAVAMTRARRSLAIVSCFRPEDLEDERMPHGVAALRGCSPTPRRASPRIRSTTTATRCSSTSAGG